MKIEGGFLYYYRGFGKNYKVSICAMLGVEFYLENILQADKYIFIGVCKIEKLIIL